MTRAFSTPKALPKVLFSISIFLGLSSASSEGFAGECKVKEPTQAVVADALKLGVVLDVQMQELAKEYRAKTGKQLKVALVARAGQNMKDILALREVDQNGRPMTVQQMIAMAEYQVPFGDSGSRDLNQVKNEIKKSFSEKNRKTVYSHFGLIFWNHPQGAARAKDETTQQWWFRHMLRPCATPEEVAVGVIPNVPRLYDEGVSRFFTDDPFELRAQILVPPPEIQDNLEKLALPKTTTIDGVEYWDNRLPEVFKGEFYNAAAAWNNTTEANSNQFVLELLAAASQPFGRVRTRGEAQNILVKTGYRPMRAMLSGAQALAGLPFASKLAPFVRLHHHEQPGYMNYAVADLVTTLSVEEYMQRNKWTLLQREIYIADKTQTDEVKKASPNQNNLYR